MTCWLWLQLSDPLVLDIWKPLRAKIQDFVLLGEFLEHKLFIFKAGHFTHLMKEIPVLRPLYILRILLDEWSGLLFQKNQDQINWRFFFLDIRDLYFPLQTEIFPIKKLFSPFIKFLYYSFRNDWNLICMTWAHYSLSLDEIQMSLIITHYARYSELSKETGRRNPCLWCVRYNWGDEANPHGSTKNRIRQCIIQS